MYGAERKFGTNDADETFHFRRGLFCKVLYHYHTFIVTIVATSVYKPHLLCFLYLRNAENLYFGYHKLQLTLRFKLDLLSLRERAHSKSRDALHTCTDFTSHDVQQLLRTVRSQPLLQRWQLVVTHVVYRLFHLASWGVWTPDPSLGSAPDNWSQIMNWPAGKLSYQAHVIDVGELGFDSRAGQIW